MYLLAEQWYVVQSLHAATSLGWVMMMTALPRVLFMIYGGAIADRYPASTIMFVTNLSRALLLLAIIGLLSVGQLRLSILLIFALLFGILDAFFWPASESMIPSIVTKEQITRANAVIQSTNQFSLIIGPIFAGFFLMTFKFYSVFAVCACCLLFASLFTALIKIQRDPVEQRKKTMGKELIEGFSYIKQSAFFVVLLGVLIVVNFFISGPISLGIPLIVDRLLHGDAFILSYLQSAFGCGALIGAIIIGLLNVRKKRGYLLLIVLLAISVLCILLSMITVVWQGIVLLFIIGIGSTFINIPLVSMIQENVDSDKMGRVMGLVMTFTIGLLPLSYALCSILLMVGLTIQHILFLSGGIVIFYSLFVSWKFSEIRNWN
jgi:DHA3 family macrolide efflux protein-like MFS transporter